MLTGSFSLRERVRVREKVAVLTDHQVLETATFSLTLTLSRREKEPVSIALPATLR
jgi:hypothetical protein